MPLFESGCFQTAADILNTLNPGDLEYLLSEPIRIRKAESQGISYPPGKPLKVQNKN
jgi:hypothetical protein